ncbi:hypothetical protein [Streptomyces sp. NPDC015680]|uniref:hypothetical protein n=1 Tax=Streptomyces sp. NPDC015680 TaxID=3364962 RepID=UPI0036F7C998
MGDYLAALTRTGGSVELARMTTGLPKNSLQNYREQEPEFAAAEKAVIQWLESANAKTVRGLSGARLTQAARLLERGASITEAAKAVNTSVSALRYASARHPFLASVLPQPITRGSETRTPERIAQLRRLWASSDKSEREIAEELGVAKNTVVSWARDLSLPTRRASGTDR